MKAEEVVEGKVVARVTLLKQTMKITKVTKLVSATRKDLAVRKADDWRHGRCCMT